MDSPHRTPVPTAVLLLTGLAGLLSGAAQAGPVVAEPGLGAAGHGLVEPAEHGLGQDAQPPKARGNTRPANALGAGASAPLQGASAAARMARGALSAAEAEKARAALGLAPAPAPVRPGASQALRAKRGPEADPGLALDPEVKEGLKAARDWIKAAVPALPAELHFDQVAAPPSAGEDLAAPSRGPGRAPGSEDAAPTPSNSTAGGGAAPAAPEGGAPANVFADLYALVVEILGHPGVWGAIGLVLLVKLMFALLRRKVKLQSAELRHQARLQGVAARSAAAAGSFDEASRQAGRARSRHRRSQHHQAQG